MPSRLSNQGPPEAGSCKALRPLAIGEVRVAFDTGMEGSLIGGGYERERVRRVDHIGAAEPDRPRLHCRPSDHQTGQNAISRSSNSSSASPPPENSPLETHWTSAAHRFRQPIKVKHAPDTNPLIVDAACRFGNAMILRHPGLVAEDRIQEGMCAPPKKSGWPPSRLFLLPKQADCEAEADNPVSVVHAAFQVLHAECLCHEDADVVSRDVV